MASLTQDQDLNVHFNGASAGGKTNVSKAPRKGGLSGRKPLGDLSNSVKATPYQATRIQKSNIFSFTEKEIGASGISQGASKKSIPKASEKVQKSTGRKALSDISNSSKLHLHEASKKNQTTKLSTVSEERSPHCSIADESFLHDHQECIKAQSKDIGMAEFLHIVGLDNDFSKQTAAARTLPVSNKIKVADLLIESPSPLKEDKLDSPPAKTPKPMNHHMGWNGDDYTPSFKLLETP
ncbi:hypothetical protein SLEP1_g41567 [Rubroshorea leprosula]|uniref:Uncharacterized protein n=1 Tax=Rubroshorea leprosula TaxID=152421 RepID=A0AAV5L6X3_9ROSI|nr:hypothetical protein SLEP1_g41567 [Rubroshorea leprosula]